MARFSKHARRWALGVRGSTAIGVAVMALASGQARASGFASAAFGGEHGHPTTDNATAIYYNPAGMALSKGTHIFADNTLVLRFSSYDRPAGEVDNPQTTLLAPGANDGKATLFNAIASPFFGATSDFGTDFIYGGVALYFPFGGAAVWDKNKAYQGNPQFPGAVDGPQRWFAIDASSRSMYVTGALGFNIRKIGLSLGISGSAIRTTVDLLRARNSDSSDDLVAGDPPVLKEGRSHLDVGGWQGGFGIGAIYDVLKQGKYFLGLSYTSQPNVAGGMTLKGSLNNTLALTAPGTTPVELTQTLPDIWRLGVRVRPTDKYELRAFANYVRWSVYDQQCVLDRTNPDRNCNYSGTSKALSDPANFGGNRPGVIQHLPRLWKDAGGVRLGGSYWFVPELETYLGAGYDSDAIPVETQEPSIMDAHKVTLAAGMRWQIIRNFALSFTATEVIFFKKSTKGKGALNKFPGPSRQPSANGVYRQFYQLFNLYLDVSFGYGGKGKSKGDKARKPRGGKADKGRKGADAGQAVPAATVARI